MIAPDVPDFAGCDGNVDRFFDPLDQREEPLDVIFGNHPFYRFRPFVVRLGLRILNPLGFLTRYPRDVVRVEPEILERDLLTAEDGFVTDHNADDVAVAPGDIDGRFDLAVVAIAVLVEPGADRDLHAELGCDRRHQFGA